MIEIYPEPLTIIFLLSDERRQKSKDEELLEMPLRSIPPQKKSANLRRVATTLESEVSKLVGIHGIRWRASVLRGSEVWLTNF